MEGDDGLLKTTDPQPMRRAVAFCSTIKDSKDTARLFSNCKSAFMKDLNPAEKDAMVEVEARHVDGTMPATKRDEELMWLKEDSGDKKVCKMLTNARCLSEGVDVPSLDAVIFVSPRNSQVDVVQSVGRVMRKSEGKKYGYIIIPVVVPDGVEADKVLDKTPFKVVWSVLNALRAHDDRFNAEINQIDLCKQKPSHIIFGTVGFGHETDGGADVLKVHNPEQDYITKKIEFKFEELQHVFYAKMVTKVGNKRYWEQWAKDIAQMAEVHIAQIKRLIAAGGKHRQAFDQLMKGLRKNINPELSEQEAIEMLSQHIISLPVFDALFGDFEFVHNNVVSKSMQKMLDLLDDERKTEEEHEKLQKFYDYVRTTVGDIKDAEGRQQLIVELYDKFFKVASPKAVKKLGMVYTPVEVVDYIIRSVDSILRTEFGRTLGDKSVHILDPFTGTGTFITRLLQSGLISKADLVRKYRHEIYANEIILLAYYIASINIESVFHSLMPEEKYTAFDGVCLTDTFQLGEDLECDSKEKEGFGDAFPQNSERVKKQRKEKITVIFGNPPYSEGQEDANDNAQNQHYPNLERRIALTYAKECDTQNKNHLYNSYIKAFRWASDRINPKEGGIVAFIINSGWIDKPVAKGIRKCFEKEFSKIYVLDLKGAKKGKIGDSVKREGDNVFDIMTGVAITILVKKGEE